MKFKKENNQYLILVNGEQVGTMHKDPSRNHNFCVIAKLNFEVKGYRNEASGKTYKQVKKDVEKLYYSLQNKINQGMELINN